MVHSGGTYGKRKEAAWLHHRPSLRESIYVPATYLQKMRRLALAAVLLLQASLNYAWETAAPWTAPNGTNFPYHGMHNDLEGLLKLQSRDGWITFLPWTSGVRRFGLNCFYSLMKYGKNRNFIIAAYDPVTIGACRMLNLPCYNATAYSASIVGGIFHFGTREHYTILYAQRNLARHVVSLGYNVHGSDIDVVFLRDVSAAIAPIFTQMQPDAIFVTEESAPSPDRTGYINMINSATYFIKASSRSLMLLEHWIKPESGVDDQQWLNNLRGVAYSFCDSYATCLSVKRRGHAAVYRHPSFFTGGSCIRDVLDPEPCHPRRLYVHYLCGVGWEGKHKAWDKLNFWFVDSHGNPMWEDGGGPHGKHAFLPCTQGHAWEGMWSSHHPVL